MELFESIRGVAHHMNKLNSRFYLFMTCLLVRSILVYIAYKYPEKLLRVKYVFLLIGISFIYLYFFGNEAADG